jgi:hypothetical protein
MMRVTPYSEASDMGPALAKGAGAGWGKGNSEMAVTLFEAGRSRAQTRRC